MTQDIDKLVARLRSMRLMATWYDGGYQATELVNPDGPVAAEVITKLQFEKATLAKRLEEAEADRDTFREYTSGLLARIHRDGGHYEADHGTSKAVNDADAIVARIYASDAESLRAELEAVKARAAKFEEERDMARSHGLSARIREKEAEDARVSAVDRAAQLESENGRLREALEPFAAMADHYPISRKYGNRPSAGPIFQTASHDVGEAEITVEHLHAASAALTGREEAGSRCREFVSDYHRPARCLNCGLRREQHQVGSRHD